jgi:hypothetical protein
VIRAAAVVGAVLLVAGCGGQKVVTVTRTVTSSAPACSSIGESALAICAVGKPAAGADETAFFSTRGGHRVRVPVQRPRGSMVGHWVTAYLSPDGKTLLAQWSAECEVPIAYFVSARGGSPRPVSADAAESVAHGWTDGGRAIVEFPNGPCGTGAKRPGIYLVSLDGRRRLLEALPRANGGP